MLLTSPDLKQCSIADILVSLASLYERRFLGVLVIYPKLSKLTFRLIMHKLELSKRCGSFFVVIVADTMFPQYLNEKNTVTWQKQ